MRVIETEIINALRNQSNFSTTPIVNNYYGKNPNGHKHHRDKLAWNDDYPGIFSYLLWGHEIAKGDTIQKEIRISDCGYATATTKSRLNALFAGLDIPMACSVRNGSTVFFLYGKETHDREISAGLWKVLIG